MKKLFLFAFLVTTVSFISCEKEEVNPNPNPNNPGNPVNQGENKWTIEGVTYTNTANSAVWNGQGSSWGLMGNGSNDSLVAFQLWFKTNNPVSGNYTIQPFISIFTSTDSTIVAISASLGSRVWQSVANSGTVTVTNTNGVISATATNISIKRTDSENTTVLSGNLTYRP